MNGGAARVALPAAVSVEVFHNFTLVHDDIMDHAESRRGRETVHVRWDEPTAILVGDLLAGIAYEQLAKLPVAAIPEALRVFSAMLRRLCEGQTLDMAFEVREKVSLEDYLAMIEGKTGALLACAMELGALAAGASEEAREAARLTGYDIGRAFQIQDDLLDLTASDAGWGKQVGGDLLTGKRTYLLLLALERAEGADLALLKRVLAGKLTETGVDAVRNVMDRLGVLNDTRDAVIFHSDAAIGRLQAAPDSPARDLLVGLVRSMQARLH
jgi:geranylgeranyl diphosphate synthase, type II